MTNVEFPPPSPALPVSKTFTYKQVDSISIQADVYLPKLEPDDANQQSIYPVLLFIHGGAWISGHRQDYCRPLFEEFLTQGFIVVSTDYRLLPESSFLHGQLEDIRDVGDWIRRDLPGRLEQEAGVKVQLGKIVAAGGSAGALLALLTPRLWSLPPDAIISIYGPTDLLRLPPKDPFGGIDIVPSSQMLKSATDFAHPPTNTPPPAGPGDWFNDRTKMGIYMFRMGATTDFLLRGLTKSKSEKGEIEYAFPLAGRVTESEVEESGISPLSLCNKLTFPPTYQIIGSKDSLFDVTHVTRLADALDKQGVPHEEHIVEGADHAFDMGAPIGGEVHQKVVKPVVEWVQRLT